MRISRRCASWESPPYSGRVLEPMPSVKHFSTPWGKGLHGADLPRGTAPAGQARAGDRLALARLLTLIENQTQEGLDGLAALYPHTGRAHVVGITGAPGTGKSTLVNELARAFRGNPEDDQRAAAPTVAIVAVDPSSPFSGGAILGDRIRMRDLSGDPGVFIRSMASRGALGGLA